MYKQNVKNWERCQGNLGFPVLENIKTEGVKERSDIFDVLMGKEVFPRKQFIQTYAKEVKNLDV